MGEGDTTRARRYTRVDRSFLTSLGSVKWGSRETNLYLWRDLGSRHFGSWREGLTPVANLAARGSAGSGWAGSGWADSGSADSGWEGSRWAGWDSTGSVGWRALDSLGSRAGGLDAHRGGGRAAEHRHHRNIHCRNRNNSQGYTSARGHTNTARITRDSNIPIPVPSRSPSRAIPSPRTASPSPNPIPNHPIPIHPNPNRGPSPIRGPNPSRSCVRPSPDHDRIRDLASCLRRMRHLWTCQRNAMSRRRLRHYEPSDLGSWSPQSCGRQSCGLQSWRLQTNARSRRCCRRNATGHR